MKTGVRGFGVLLLLLIGLAAGTRLQALGQASFDVDEYLHVFSAQSLNAEGRPLLPSRNEYRRAWPYTHAVASSFRMFGVSETAARLPSVLVSLLTVLLAAFVARRWFGDAAALTAAGILALSPMPVMTARLCRMYTCFEFAYLLAFFLTWEFALRDGVKLRWRFAGGAAALAALRTALIFQKLASVFVFGLAGYMLGLAVRRPKSAATVWALLGAAAVAAGALAGKLDLADIWETMNFAPAWAAESRYHANFYWSLWQKDLKGLWLLGLGGLCVLPWARGRLGWYVLTAFAVPFALHSLVFDWKFPRYVAQLFPIFAIGAGGGLALAAGWIRDRLTPRLGAAGARALIAGLALGTFAPMAALTLMPSPEHISPEWREAFGYVAARRSPQDALIASVPLAAHYYTGRPADFYLDNYALVDYRSKNKQDEQGRWIDWYTGLPMIGSLKEFASVTAAYPHGWLVMDKDRFEKDGAMPPELRAWLAANARCHAVPGGAWRATSVIIYEWGASP